MRQLVESRSVVGVLIALYVCASLAAIPVPRPVASFMADMGISLASAPDESGCSCGTASTCSTGDSCCCAPKALTSDEPVTMAEGEGQGFELMAISCTPELKWFLAAVPPVFSADKSGMINLDTLRGEELVAYVDEMHSLNKLDIASPPPRMNA